jgi:hypothetical protein
MVQINSTSHDLAKKSFPKPNRINGVHPFGTPLNLPKSPYFSLKSSFFLSRPSGFIPGRVERDSFFNVREAAFNGFQCSILALEQRTARRTVPTTPPRPFPTVALNCALPARFCILPMFGMEFAKHWQKVV